MKDRKRDLVIIEKVLRYCDEIEKTHAAFRNDKDLFFNKEEGFIYRNSITMPILQIVSLSKIFLPNLSQNTTQYRGKQSLVCEMYLHITTVLSTMI